MADRSATLKTAAGAALSGQRGHRAGAQDDYTEALFGELKRNESGRLIVQPVAINLIYPDATQPRRALPSIARRAWNGDPAQLPTLFANWLAYKPEYKRLLLDILNGEETEHPQVLPPEVAALAEIVELAASIRRAGLTNPITIVQNGDNYGIETGERRWLAYHLLVYHTGEDQWTRIPARIVDAFSRWRQAAENNTRQDLNAIGKARQLAVLLMELLREQHTFQPLHTAEHEQDFYAQVAEGNNFRVPRGKSELLLNAMGLSHSSQLRQYRALLRLDREIWETADDENWTENRCRDFLQVVDTDTDVTVSQTESTLNISQITPTDPPALSTSKKPKKFIPLVPDEVWQDMKSFRQVAPGLRGYEQRVQDEYAERLRRVVIWAQSQLVELEGQGDD